ncbi:MAG: KpsF/GutQ family sugar-phosphate isomerase [Alphaproteobacteria bacterium]|nr:KpsF/GutQ family sugar-phosphate isomerase [Alphaproteobacteria bacterium]
MTAAGEVLDTALVRPQAGCGDAQADIDAARRVLATEARALERLAETLTTDFARAVDMLDSAAGRIVVSGMGKSGHIARKIAATLASTGAPALYIHPGEASHGDLGMIAPEGDAVMVLSNSGKTPELADIATYAKRFRVPLVAVVGPDASAGAGAFLAEQADIALVLPPAPEACPMGLAPTTSTTMMLGLGDALAIALLERRGFTPRQFGMLHPGGRLGRAAVVRVRDIMHSGDAVPLVAPDTVMSDTLVEMTKKSLGCAGIVDAHGRLIGIITDGDLRRHMSADLLTRESREVMTAGPRTIRADALASEALGLMNGIAGEREITSLFVVDDERPVGILHIHDCYRAGVA